MPLEGTFVILEEVSSYRLAYPSLILKRNVFLVVYLK